MASSIPKVGFVSLGCPKAGSDSERILTQLRAEGYDISKSYQDADLVVVNTCGFIDSAVKESMDAIGEAVKKNGKVIVTGAIEGRETLMITGGSITLDASFNKGGDIIDLPGRLSSFSAVRSGSSAVLTNGKDNISIPVGTFGADLLFDDASLVLVYSNGSFQIGNQILGSTSAVLIG